MNGKPATEDPAVRQQLAQFSIESKAITYNMFRGFSKRLKGALPGPEGSINKLFGSELNIRIANFATELLGPYAQLTQGSPFTIDNGRWPRAALWQRLLTIGGGTSEIQRGILGDRMLSYQKVKKKRRNGDRRNGEVSSFPIPGSVRILKIAS